MAPPFRTKSSFKTKNIKYNSTKGPSISNNKNKRKTWTPDNRFFDGSLQEGQGFAFTRKQKVQHEYKKLLRKQRWKMQDSKPQLREEYPEHLKHLYLAEEVRLEKEEQMRRNCKGKIKAGIREEVEETLVPASVDSSAFTGAADSHEKPAATVSSEEQPENSQTKSSHKDTTRQRKQKKLSSFQKSKQEYERLRKERERKREEYLTDKAQREEALKKYKEKKMATYQLLKKKTKKGQPNLNLQMELLLQKIQAQCK